MASDSDWAPLERVEFETLSDIWDYSKLGARTAGESGLIIIQAIPDFHAVMKDMAGDYRSAESKARRITRRMKSVVNHLTAAKNDFQRIPADIMKVYAEEIAAARRKTRKKIDMSN